MDDHRLKYHALGFLEVVDVPSLEELKIFYADHYYQSERGNYRKSYPPIEYDYLNLKIAQKAAIIDEIRHENTPGKMLDVGCGEGFALEWFHKKGWRVEGIDHSVDGVAGMHPELQHLVQVGDLFGLLNDRITDGELYDLVWLNNVLEHVAEPVTLLNALRQLISPDGVLVVTVPNDGSKYQEFLLTNGDIPRRFWISLPDHLAYFNYNSLKTTVEATGWVCHDIIGDFPIDFFLLHEGSNYINDPSKGPAAHRARIGFELMLGQLPYDEVNNFYRSMAKVGLGRSLIAFLKPTSKNTREERN